MYQKILIATDGSELSQKAVEHGIALAALTGGKVIALQVVPRYPVSYFEGGASVPNDQIARTEKQWAEGAQATVDAVKSLAKTQGVQAEAITANSDLIAEAITSAAKKHACDLIVMASHGRRGLTRMLLGSETTHVLTHSHVPVLVLR